MSKHISVVYADNINFDMIKENNNCTCNCDAHFKPKCSSFLIFKFIDPCGSHFMAYFNK